MKKIIIIGGGAAGAKAASKAKRLDSNNEIELYTREKNIAYSLCGLPYYIEGIIKNIKRLIIKTPQDFEKMGIKVFLNHELKEIYPEKNIVKVNEKLISYDKLILATGAHVYLPKVENINANNIFTLRNLISGVKIKRKIKKSKKVIIIGGGFIAIELIEAFTKNNLDVIIIEKNNRLMSNFDEEFSNEIEKIIKLICKEKIKIYLNEQNYKINTDDNHNFKNIILESKEEIFADFCVLSTGTIPSTSIAKKCGINLGLTKAIKVNKRMETNYKNIYACGDCCEKYCILTRQPTYLGLGTIANKEGRVAAINATSEDNYENFDGVLKSTITKFYDFAFSKTGLTYSEAKEYSKNIHIEPIEVTITKSDKASYMPNSNKITIKIVIDKQNGEILGAQCIGKKNFVAQRINTISALLKTKSTINDLLHLDLAYSPPFSGSIDPILTCAYKLKELMKK